MVKLLALLVITCLFISIAFTQPSSLSGTFSSSISPSASSSSSSSSATSSSTSSTSTTASASISATSSSSTSASASTTPSASPSPDDSTSSTASFSSSSSSSASFSATSSASPSPNNSTSSTASSSSSISSSSSASSSFGAIIPSSSLSSSSSSSQSFSSSSSLTSSSSASSSFGAIIPSSSLSSSSSSSQSLSSSSSLTPSSSASPSPLGATACELCARNSTVRLIRLGDLTYNAALTGGLISPSSSASVSLTSSASVTSSVSQTSSASPSSTTTPSLTSTASTTSSVSSTPSASVSLGSSLSNTASTTSTRSLTSSSSPSIASSLTSTSSVTPSFSSTPSSSSSLSISPSSTPFLNATVISAVSICGVGSFNLSNNTLHLTHGTQNEAGNAYFADPINATAGFSIQFNARIFNTSRPTGDGFAFLIEQDPRGCEAIGDPGQGLGYENIVNAVAVEFDVYFNAPQRDPDNDHVSIQVSPFLGEPVTAQHNSSSSLIAPISLANTSVRLYNETGLIDINHLVTIQYRGDNKIMLVTLDGVTIVPGVDAGIIDVLELTNAFIGFSASTGGSYQAVDISNFFLQTPFPAAASASPSASPGGLL